MPAKKKKPGKRKIKDLKVRSKKAGKVRGGLKIKLTDLLITG